MKTKADEEFDRRIRVDWDDVSEYNGGRPSYRCEVAPGRERHDIPGVSVYYEQNARGGWHVALEFCSECVRYSDTFDNEASAKVRAKALVRALRALWPEVHRG